MTRYALALACGLAVPAASASAQSLADQIVGEWSLVSLVEDHGGKAEHPLGEKMHGSIILDKSGGFSTFLASDDRPKSASHPMVPVGPVIAYYGTYSVDGNTLIYHVQGATYPNFEGTDQKGTITVKGDTLTSMRTITGGAAPFTSTVAWKRVK